MLFSSKREEDIGSFILTELRGMRESQAASAAEIRRSSEANYSELRSSVTSIRDGVTNLAQAMSASAATTDNTREELVFVKKALITVQTDVDTIRSQYNTDQTQTKSSWDGPLKVARLATWTSAFIAAVVYIIKFAGSLLVVIP